MVDITGIGGFKVNSGEKLSDTAVFTQLEKIRASVQGNASRIKSQGKWADRIDPDRALVQRIPEKDTSAPGFDAGIACALDLIPREKQGIASELHSNYTPQNVAKVDREIRAGIPAESETCYWLAASSLCIEGNVNARTFVNQVRAAKTLLSSPEQRQAAAKEMWRAMDNAFEVDKTIVPGMDVAFSRKDGGMQSAYIKGYPVAVQHASKLGLWFIGTYHPSLGLESFEWSKETDDGGRPKSGALSPQFVKCASKEELTRALKAIKEHFEQPEEN